MSTTKIGYIVGSISSASINRQLAGAVAKLAPADVELTEVPISQLPFYTPDSEADFPQIASDFKNQISQNDGLIIYTPEYNNSIPGVLKNAIDWASRPWGQHSFAKLPVAVLGTSISPRGAQNAQERLKDIVTFGDGNVLADPSLYLQFTEGLIDAEGNFTNEEVKAQVQQWLDATVAHVRENQGVTA